MLNEITTSEAESDVQESIVEASATSHLRNVTLPEESSSEVEKVELPDVKKPKTLKAAYAALEEAQKETDPRVRKHKVAVITGYIHELSQGHTAIEFSAKERSAMAASQNDAAEEMQIEMLGRQFPVVKKWIGRLKEQLKSANAEIAALKEPKK